MAIKCVSGAVTTETVSGNIITGGSPLYDSSGNYYSGSETKTFSDTVQYVEIVSGSVYYSINGKSVTFSYSSSLSGARQAYSAKVTYGAATTTVTDVKATSGSTIDYVNTTQDTTKYMWTRPTTFDLQMPWNYIASWTLSRAAWGTASTNSMCVDSTAGTIKSSSSLATSGTTVYTLPISDGIRYGDYLTLTVTPKPCANLSKTTFNCKVARGNTSIKDTSFASGKSFSEEVDNGLITISWEGGTWATTDSEADSQRKNGLPSGCENFNVRITKSSSIASLPVTVEAYAYSSFCECWYTKDLEAVTFKDTSAQVWYGGSQLGTSASNYRTLGTLAAGTTSGAYTFAVKADAHSNVKKSWPKCVWLCFRYTIGGSHCYSDSVATDSDYKGQWTMGGDGGSGGPSYGS